MHPTDILTAVFFSMNGSPVMTRTSALVPTTSSVISGNGAGAGAGGGEWANNRIGEWTYKRASGPGGAEHGISSSGLWSFGSADRSPGSSLHGPSSPAGVEYGITSSGDNPATGNGSLMRRGLIRNQVVLTVGLPDGYTLSGISNVSFLYGPARNGRLLGRVPAPPVTETPEPSSLLLLASGLLPLLYRRRPGRMSAPKGPNS